MATETTSNSNSPIVIVIIIFIISISSSIIIINKLIIIISVISGQWMSCAVCSRGSVDKLPHREDIRLGDDNCLALNIAR
ncbi:hypothetical protein AWZ03_013434 [Drosophila navojoa]|uniref:Transmembrane protein n=1 Tax=Drosophila navojoa TaxID=7232 RepID=A0A484AUK8_DRONA|nr:hypothetical protein AWZ03_013434 [Drosophila navojoa]